MQFRSSHQTSQRARLNLECLDARTLPNATPTPIPVGTPETRPAEVAPVPTATPVENTAGTTDPALVAVALPIRPKEEIERDIATARKALEQAQFAEVILKAQLEVLGV